MAPHRSGKHIRKHNRNRHPEYTSLDRIATSCVNANLSPCGFLNQLSLYCHVPSKICIHRERGVELTTFKSIHTATIKLTG